MSKIPNAKETVPEANNKKARRFGEIVHSIKRNKSAVTDSSSSHFCLS